MQRLLALLLTIWTLPADGEPWLSNRFAQNCAGCHDTGRPNRPVLDRRCTLSCQGCHVNPNGGGLRSTYGKWSEKWLTLLRDDREPGTESTRMGHTALGSEFLESIPPGDPYHTRRSTTIEAGGDIRYLRTDENSFLMATTFGLRWKTLDRVSVVFEPQMFGRPKTDPWALRPVDGSAYILVDDLPLNTFIMSGRYRPLFGLATPDHTSLPARIFAEAATGSPRSQGLLFRATTIGLAPNVPYFNLHVIDGDSGALEDGGDVRSGVAFNTGLRFVSAGLSFQYSWWRTGEAPALTTMEAIDVGAQIWRFTLNYQWLSAGRYGSPVTLDAEAQEVRVRLRTWREAYVETTWETQEIRTDRPVVTPQRLRYGVRLFPWPGLDLRLTTGGDGQWLSEVHLYF